VIVLAIVSLSLNAALLVGVAFLFWLVRSLTRVASGTSSRGQPGRGDEVAPAVSQAVLAIAEDVTGLTAEQERERAETERAHQRAVRMILAEDFGIDVQELERIVG